MRPLALAVLLAGCTGSVGGGTGGGVAATGGGDATGGGVASTGGGAATGGGVATGGGNATGGGTAATALLPDARLYAWTPGVNVGVPGGIPARTTVCATVDANMYGQGTVDAAPAIRTAFNGCTAGGVVMLPAGTYRLDTAVDRLTASNVTLRGAGVGQTLLRANRAGMRMLWLGNADAPVTPFAITSGATKGSSTVMLADTAAVKVGGFVRLVQDDPAFVISSGAPTMNNKVMTVIVRVTAKTAGSVTFSPPLPFDLTTNPTLFAHQALPMVNSGIEDLTFDATGALTAFQWEHGWGCWAKNIEVKNSPSRQLILVGFINGEIRHNLFHLGVGGGPDHEGVTLTSDDHFNLIEDNVSYFGGFPAIVLGDGPGNCHGNVVAYNFSYGVDTTDPDVAAADLSVNHGPHNAFNLFEGNISGGFISDGYHGSASHDVVFRNWLTATHPTATQNLIALNIGRWSTYFSVLGNVLGSSAFPTSGVFMPEMPFSYATPVIWKVGFPNLGNNGFDTTWGSLTGPPDYRGQSANGHTLQERDLYVQGTLIRHGNYDFKTKTTEWSPDLASHVLPPSLYRTAAPPWWGSSPWPSIGPDLTPMNGANPAYARFKAANPTAVVPPP